MNFPIARYTNIAKTRQIAVLFEHRAYFRKKFKGRSTGDKASCLVSASQRNNSRAVFQRSAMKTHIICATFKRNCNPAVQHSLIPRNETLTFMTSSSEFSTRQTACTGPQPSMFPLAFFTAKRTPSFQRNVSGGLSPKSTDVRNHVALETCFPFCDIAASTAIFCRSFELRIFMRVRVQRYQTAPRVRGLDRSRANTRAPPKFEFVV